MNPDIVEVTQEAFWSRVEKRGQNECWPWVGAVGSTGDGYGRMWVNGKMRPATQMAWELANGEPFPHQMVACHTCDNTICVNPTHIWPGTQSDNLRDCVEKGRHKAIKKERCQRGHEMIGANVRPVDGGRRCVACERENTKLRMRRYRERARDNG